MESFSRIVLSILLVRFVFAIPAYSQVHTTYLWHLHQPIYWPDASAANPARYQLARESELMKNNGQNTYGDGLAHPLNNLPEIFQNADRVAVYQHRAKTAVQSLQSFPEAGAQVNYSGALMENVNSLGDANQWGYSSSWKQNFVTARSWTTTGGKPRMDIVGFSAHHVLSPLVSDRVLRKDIQVHKYLYAQNFGNNPVYSKGYWPAECSFSERNVKVLSEEGFSWSVIANSHLARTLTDYPLSFGTNACNLDPPNRADKVPVNGQNWWNGQIDGRGGAFAAPYCYQAHKARYVDPATGSSYKITVVPMCDLLSYQNGYALQGLGDIQAHIAPFDDPTRPSIVLLAHDGDNAWGGGYDYYTNSVPGFASQASSTGYVPTTIEQFLLNHPVPENAVVHVEDGSWVNAANDWGHPQFINWLWPMYTSNHQFNPNGWTEDVRNWGVLTAAENYVLMAEDLGPAPSIAQIAASSSGSSAVEKAWHFLLPAFASDYMYYGSAIDMEVKQTIACNEAISLAQTVIDAHPGTDPTPPSVFVPQRWPYNPGGTGFGPTYGYQAILNPSDFFVWTFAFDVSGIQSVELKYRVDFDGHNPLDQDENDTYAGGLSVGSWNSLPMTYRNFPSGNVTNNPDIDFFVLPTAIAGMYYAQVQGLQDTLVDYFVEARDVNGNISRTAIQHVYVGETGGGGTIPNDPDISWSPAYPTPDDTITISVANASQAANLHWGVNGWTAPNAAYWTPGSTLWSDNAAIESPMNGPVNNTLSLKIGPFNNPAQVVNAVNFVLHYANNTWDNNNGQDYHIPISQEPGGRRETPVSESLLFPNPANQVAYLQIDQRISLPRKVELMNPLGMVLKSWMPLGHSLSLDLSGISPGIYFIRFGRDQELLMESIRLVIIR